MVIAIYLSLPANRCRYSSYLKDGQRRLRAFHSTITWFGDSNGRIRSKRVPNHRWRKKGRLANNGSMLGIQSAEWFCLRACLKNQNYLVKCISISCSQK